MVGAAILARGVSGIAAPAYALTPGWVSWINGSGQTSWAYCDYYPDAAGAAYGDYYGAGFWCYMQDFGTWKSISPNWQQASPYFPPGEDPD
jgi:hypothetical protein